MLSGHPADLTAAHSHFATAITRTLKAHYMESAARKGTCFADYTACQQPRMEITVEHNVKAATAQAQDHLSSKYVLLRPRKSGEHTVEAATSQA